MFKFTNDLLPPTHSNCASRPLEARYVWAMGGTTMLGRVTAVNVEADEVTLMKLDGTQTIIFSMSNFGLNNLGYWELDCVFGWDSDEPLEEGQMGNYIVTETQESPEDDPRWQQIGGDHYKDLAIQPIDFIEANDIPFLEACIIKRMCRHAHKTGKGKQDVQKAIHELQLIMKFRYPE